MNQFGLFYIYVYNEMSVQGVGTSERRKDIRKECRRVNWLKYYVFMYENGKIRLVETILRMRGEGIKENEFNDMLKAFL
jgi:hypothetical protein